MITDRQIDEAMDKLRIAFGVETTADLVREMVNRFLCWKLPKDFNPDGGISFTPTRPHEGDEFDNLWWWPSGTNLFNAEQAREMIEHMLATPKETK